MLATAILEEEEGTRWPWRRHELLSIHLASGHGRGFPKCNFRNIPHADESLGALYIGTARARKTRPGPPGRHCGDNVVVTAERKCGNVSSAADGAVLIIARPWDDISLMC